jgi:hypothetical protein
MSHWLRLIVVLATVWVILLIVILFDFIDEDKTLATLLMAGFGTFNYIMGWVSYRVLDHYAEKDDIKLSVEPSARMLTREEWNTVKDAPAPPPAPDHTLRRLSRD